MGSCYPLLPIFVHYCINGKTVLYLPIYDFNVGKYVDIDTVKSVKFFKIYGGCDESSITCRWIWTRISEESHLKPKPMIEIGGKPILWHIMKEYSHYGYNDFIICCGYKQM